MRAAHVLAVAGGVDEFRHSFAPCERRGSVRRKLCRASMRESCTRTPEGGGGGWGGGGGA